MKENFQELKEKFNEIKNLGWVKSTSHGNGNVGLTFETLLGKERENFPVADYKGIEIKTSIEYYSRPYITLFSSSPDGKYIFQTNILKEKYGKKDNTLKNSKKFYARITGNKFKKINNYYMKLNINYKNKKIILEIYDLNFNLIDNDCFWDFSSIQEKIKKKMKYLAYITAQKRYTYKEVEFKYTNIEFYKIKDLNKFLNLLSKGIIKICFKVGIHKKGIKKGKTYDHGTGFEIKKEHIFMLYEKIEQKK